MADIWFTSDTHYHHKNIVRGVTEWGNDPTKGQASVERTRNFQTLEEHDQTLIKNINKVVKHDDILYHLGDVAFGGKEYVAEFMNNLRCKTVHLVLGNHDHHIERNREELQKLFRSVQYLSAREIGGYEMVLCHYAMRTWPKAHKGTWMLFGHSHGTLEDYEAPWEAMSDPKVCYRTMDVGMDTHPEFRPYHIDELAAIMKNRVPLGVDHHNGSKNNRQK